MVPVCFCGGPFQTNAYLFKSEDQTILFDAPLGVRDWLVSSGVSIDVLVLTHLHIDHVLDVEALVDEFDCPIWSHSQPCEELTFCNLLSQLTGISFKLGDFEINRLLAEGETVDLGASQFRVIHVPGHSPDSLCFHNAENDILIGGDVLFQQGIGRTDFSHSDHHELISGIQEKILLLPEETTVYPGHGPTTTIGSEKSSNPFIR